MYKKNKIIIAAGDHGDVDLSYGNKKITGSDLKELQEVFDDQFRLAQTNGGVNNVVVSKDAKVSSLNCDKFGLDFSDFNAMTTSKTPVRQSNITKSKTTTLPVSSAKESKSTTTNNSEVKAASKSLSSSVTVEAGARVGEINVTMFGATHGGQVTEQSKLLAEQRKAQTNVSRSQLVKVERGGIVGKIRTNIFNNERDPEISDSTESSIPKP